jgi:hypothetical protein
LQAEILNGLESDEDADDTGEKSSPLADDGVELTEAAILSAAGEDSVDDVVQLIFRDKQLSSLSTPRSIDFDRLMNLEVLSLSHNLLEDIEPLSMLVALVELNLNFNHISDLSPLYECELLEKLFISHNEVKSVEGLETGCPKLKELALFSNRLEDIDELLNTLHGLPELRELHIGENPCCAAPSKRYGLLCEFPSLEVFDGQKVSSSDRKFAAAFLEARSKADGPDRADTQDITEQVPRPVTAPSVCARPPLPRSSNSSAVAAALAPLPGQKLRSSRANRIDDLLTQSREASPEVAESRVPALDLQSIDLSEPDRALALLTSHHTALQQCLDTMQIDRENLRFQVRLLEQDKESQQIDQLHADIERLEIENRNSQAVHSEHSQLQCRLAEVEKALSMAARSAATGTGNSHAQDASEDSDALDHLRWENQLLEKRLNRMKKYSDQLRHNFLSLQVKTRQGSSSHAMKDDSKLCAVEETVDTELSTILADNEAMLRRLQGDVSKTASGKATQSSVHAGLVKHVQCSQVDVLTLAEEGSEDVEYHGKAL